MSTESASIEFVSVWKQVTPELQAELVAFWAAHNAIPEASVAAARARQAVCIGRDAEGRIVAVGTAFLRVLQRLRQPMYYYRQFFAPDVRGLGQAMSFYNRARQILQAHNAALAAPESLGVLLELESALLAKHYDQAYVAAADSTFIGYSPRGLQLRVSYFEGARLLAPARLAPRGPTGSLP
ncbi:hypothetical protein [Lysobacter terrae]